MADESVDELDALTVEGPAGPIEVKATGSGHAVVLIPSLGRGADDVANLAGRLASGGVLGWLRSRGLAA